MVQASSCTMQGLGSEISNVLTLPLITALLLAPPVGDTPVSDPETSDGESFGPLEADPDQPDQPDQPGSDEPDHPGSGSGSYGGALAPLPNYADESGRDPSPKPEPEPEPKPKPKPKPKPEGFAEPEDYGPFFEPEPVSELRFVGAVEREHPFASVADGKFCFVEQSSCQAALILDASVGVGLNVITSNRGLDVPYSEFRVRGGLTLRPIKIARRQWHAWGVGVVASYSLGSGSITATNRDPSDPFAGITETDPISSWRLALLNQLWLSQKRNALHLDVTLGGTNSSVLDATGRYWGTHVELGLGFGGWGGLFVSGDFLDQDARVVFGLRGHGIATGPAIALILLGLVAGGVAL